jgi:hypothetical protein
MNSLFFKIPVTSSEKEIIGHKVKETNWTDSTSDSSIHCTRHILMEI